MTVGAFEAPPNGGIGPSLLITGGVDALLVATVVDVPAVASVADEAVEAAPDTFPALNLRTEAPTRDGLPTIAVVEAAGEASASSTFALDVGGCGVTLPALLVRSVMAMRSVSVTADAFSWAGSVFGGQAGSFEDRRRVADETLALDDPVALLGLASGRPLPCTVPTAAAGAEASDAVVTAADAGDSEDDAASA